MINLAHLSPDFPLWVSEEEYQKLVQRKDQGWSHCRDNQEWMAKLHYLRDGFKQGRISKAEFFQREKDLVLLWWQRWC